MEDIDAIGIFPQVPEEGAFQVDHEMAGRGGQDEEGEQDRGRIGEEPGIDPSGLGNDMSDEQEGEEGYQGLDDFVFHYPPDFFVEGLIKIDPGGQGSQPEIVKAAEREKVERVEPVEMEMACCLEVMQGEVGSQPDPYQGENNDQHIVESFFYQPGNNQVKLFLYANGPVEIDYPLIEGSEEQLQVDAKGEQVEKVLPDGCVNGGLHPVEEKIDPQDQDEPEAQVEGPYTEYPPYIEVPDADISGPFLFRE